MNSHPNGPRPADVQAQLRALDDLPDDPDMLARAALGADAIAFIHFDPPSAQSNVMEALVDAPNLYTIDRGMYVRVHSLKDARIYIGRVIEGPFYNPDALRRDAAPVKFLILRQGGGKLLSLPDYHGVIYVELLGEVRAQGLVGATRRPHPGSPVKAYRDDSLREMLNLDGNIVLGHLDSYPDIQVTIDENDKKVMPRNWLTVGTIGGGKSNTNQVMIEESLRAGFAQIVIDPEGEFVFMDEPSEMTEAADLLPNYDRQPQGVPWLRVYKPFRTDSYRDDAVAFCIPFDGVAPELIAELTELNDVQHARFMALYEQAVNLIRKENPAAPRARDDMDIAHGYPGMTLERLLTMLDEEIDYQEWKKYNPTPKGKRGKASEEESEEETSLRIYAHTYQLKPLIGDAQDAISYRALRRKLRELNRTRIFDQPDVPPLDPRQMCYPGRLSVIDLSGTDDQQVTNLVIADILARVFHYKIGLDPAQNLQRKVCITIEEAHGFVSRERQGKMQQTLDQLRRIARRGRKRWLTLHFVTQSPQHLPAELFELANNKIIHQTTGSDNLRILRTAAGSVNEKLWEEVPTLGVGRAIVISNQFPHPLIVQMRPAASKRYHVD